MTKWIFLMLAGQFMQPASQHEAPAKALYSKHCSACHGDTGDRGKFGARNLKVSQLNDSSIVKQISKGKGIMPSFARRLKPDEVQLLVNYIKSLRTL